MIKTTTMLLEQLKDYKGPANKLARMAARGEVTHIVRGLYETDRSTSPYLLAGSIYGPSYISFEFALSWYDLIPEAVYTVTCASFEKKKKKMYQTPFGLFTYRDVPSKVFPLELNILQEGEYYFRMASPEKALCDELYMLPPVANVRELFGLLEDNLRIEEDDLRNLDRDTIAFLAEHYHCTSVRKLVTLLRRIR